MGKEKNVIQIFSGGKQAGKNEGQNGGKTRGGGEDTGQKKPEGIAGVN